MSLTAFQQDAFAFDAFQIEIGPEFTALFAEPNIDRYEATANTAEYFAERS